MESIKASVSYGSSSAEQHFKRLCKIKFWQILQLKILWFNELETGSTKHRIKQKDNRSINR